ncbi:MAG: hypothetical protein WC593_05325 [Methanoregula sp.]
MKDGLFTHRKGMQVLCFFAVLSLLLVSCGCTQLPAGSQPTPVVTVTQPDSTHILITYPGSPQTDKLVELEISITDSNGKVTTKSMGSRLATTPIQYGSSYQITGSFDGKDRVYVTGYFSDGSQKTIIDTTI